ncbi:MAG: DAK2 domain-containing protein [Firmicutes bacterium]|nr:DAK2 domain-containing protein [Bacillota bacterium]
MAERRFDASMLVSLLQGGFLRLEAEKDRVDALNVFPVPDGDTGTNMWFTLREALRETEPLAQGPLRQAAEAMTRGSLLGARGNSGVILSQILRGVGEVLAKSTNVDGRTWATAWHHASEVARTAVMRPVEGTILTVVRRAAEAAQRAAHQSNDLDTVHRAMVAEAKQALAQTPELLPVLKRAGVVDSGGAGLCAILEGMQQVLSGESSQPEIAEAASPMLQPTSAAFSEAESAALPGHEPQRLAGGDFPFTFCTEFVVEISDPSFQKEAFRERIASFGDSLVMVGESPWLHIHLHTDHPGTVLEAALAYGKLHRIKIDNMRDQYLSLVAQPSEAKAEVPVPAASDSERVDAQTKADPSVPPSGIVAICNGKGFARLFRSLGAAVVEGGPTQNPSVAEIAEAVDHLPTPYAILLPNHDNVILAATEASKIAHKPVFVLPTRSIPAGLAAALAFVRDRDIQENLQRMREAAARVTTGYVTQVIRDSEWDDLQLHKGEFVGVLEEHAVAQGEDARQVLAGLIEKMVHDASDDVEVLALYSGADLPEEEAEAVVQWAQQHFPQLEVEHYQGGQPLYPYLVSLE